MRVRIAGSDKCPTQSCAASYKRPQKTGNNQNEKSKQVHVLFIRSKGMAAIYKEHR